MADYMDKGENEGPKEMRHKPKRKKIVRSYRWKQKWVRQDNIVAGSKTLWMKKWVKVKYVPE